MKTFKLILMLSLAVLVMDANAQSRIFFDLGASIPMGNFGKVDGNEAGYATVGFGYGVAFDYEIAEGHRLGLYTGVTSHGVDTDAFSDDAGFDVTAKSNYQTIPFLLYYAPHFALGDKLDFETQLRTGVVFNRSPELESALITADSETSTNFGLGLNLGLNYMISEQVTAGINWGWLVNNGSFESGDIDMWHYGANLRLGYSF